MAFQTKPVKFFSHFMAILSVLSASYALAEESSRAPAYSGFRAARTCFDIGIGILFEAKNSPKHSSTGASIAPPQATLNESADSINTINRSLLAFCQSSTGKTDRFLNEVISRNYDHLSARQQQQFKNQAFQRAKQFLFKDRDVAQQSKEFQRFAKKFNPSSISEFINIGFGKVMPELMELQLHITITNDAAGKIQLDQKIKRISELASGRRAGLVPRR